MLTRVDGRARSLFEEHPSDKSIGQISEATLLEQARSVHLVQARREQLDQDIAFGARPFILCGLPIRRLPSGVNTYTRRNGQFFLEVVGHPEYGVPFGQDRLVLIWIATLAVRYRSQVVSFRSASDILTEFGLSLNGAHYRRLEAGFKRVFGSSIFFGTQEDRIGAAVWDCGRSHFFDQMRLWFKKDSKAGGENMITLSDHFWRELQAHPIPVDAEVVMALASNPGCLDLYTWLSWRCYNAKGNERIPLFGPMGLANQLGVQDYARERKFRERLLVWLKLVRLYWPQCPAVVTKNGAFLELSTAQSICNSKQNLSSAQMGSGTRVWTGRIHTSDRKSELR